MVISPHPASELWINQKPFSSSGLTAINRVSLDFPKIEFRQPREDSDIFLMLRLIPLFFN